MSFFRDLYNGQYCPVEQMPDTDEYRAASKALAEISAKLVDSLTDEQKRLFEKYQADFADCVSEVYAEAFRQGFLLGAEFIKEIPHESRSPDKE